MDSEREEVSPLRMYPTRKLDGQFLDQVALHIQRHGSMRNVTHKELYACTMGLPYSSHQPEEWNDETTGFE